MITWHEIRGAGSLYDPGDEEGLFNVYIDTNDDGYLYLKQNDDWIVLDVRMLRELVKGLLDMQEMNFERSE